MKTIPLTLGLVATVDDADFVVVRAAGPWHAVVRRGTYARRHCKRPDGTRAIQLLHTFLTGWPYVDHINGDGLDNRRSNLRPATQSQNNANSRRRKDNRSGLRGVRSVNRRWRAEITINRKTCHLGYYATAEDAARAYDAAALEAYGEFASPNFPTDADGNVLQEATR